MSVAGGSTTIYPGAFLLGAWRVRPTLHRLERDGEEVQIEARAMDVLVDLARHPRQLRSKRRLLHVVWGEAFVSDDVLTHAIWSLRKALGDDPKNPEYIQTIPRKGYRLVAEVEWESAPEAVSEPPPRDQPEPAAGPVLPAEPEPGPQAQPARPPKQRPEPETRALTEPMPEAGLESGLILGDRYQIRSRLGGGGMGEVWRAYDLKLRVEVALKALHPHLFQDAQRRDLLRREVRAAREVISPNVCRIFDLIEIDGRELVSMENIDGQTLLEVLQERGPLELEEAQEIASQFLAGLKAIHEAGLVHRDVKPENIMLTRAGRVVVMDFGLARSEADAVSTISGSPAYMAPEQMRGEALDSRADLYAAGVVLAEMVSPDGVKDRDSRESVWEGVRQEPAQLPDSPWAPILRRAVAKERADRHDSAERLIRALEEVTVRVVGAEDLTPYPGLASFSEKDARFFFGREAEVERMWRQFESPARLLAVVGPSGAGKTSFLRAGVFPAAPADWTIMRCTPGNSAVAALRRALALEVGDRPDILQDLVDAPDAEAALLAAARHWRSRHGQALVIVDQFEELFTLNPAPAQAAFANLVARLPLEADVHVVLAMRDDFLMEAHRHEALRTVFSDLTGLESPTGEALRRAVVEPARRCGYAFEDDALVEGMLAEVEGERGALPVLAFALTLLWERRDRENGLLTRGAYREIGGISGALARHAESALERIGGERRPIARELFRNLVTSRGTRAAREVDELLSVFPAAEREAAREVLGELIDARLLTSYEIEGEGEKPLRRVEIVHESLLANWPRLVRWQTQDADAAQLRDELRQAAHTWQEHDLSDDLLWTGTAYREYQLWRERYPGGLSAEEESFAGAMTSLAESRKRRRRVAVATVILVLLGVLTIVGGLWRTSDKARREAQAAARRAEASKLLALGRLELDEFPTGALAYALASLELADQPPARRFALEVLYRGPVAIKLDETEKPWVLDFSLDGRWLAVGRRDGRIELWSREGGDSRTLQGHEGQVAQLEFVPDSDLLMSVGKDDHIVRLWSVSTGQLIRSLEVGEPVNIRLCGERGARVATMTDGEWSGRFWPLDGGRSTFIGSRRLFSGDDVQSRLAHSTCAWLTYAEGGQLLALPLDRLEEAVPRVVATHEEEITGVASDPDGTMLATADKEGQIRLWSLEDSRFTLTRTLQGPRHRIWYLGFDRKGSKLAACSDQTVRVWSLDEPVESEPRILRSKDVFYVFQAALDAGGRWAASSEYSGGVALWPLLGPWPEVLRGHTSGVRGLAMALDGTWMATSSIDGTVRVWSPASAPQTSRALPAAVSHIESFADGRSVVGVWKAVSIVPLAGGERLELAGFRDQIWAVASSPDGRFVAAGGGQYLREEAIVRVWDLETGEVRILDPGDGRWITRLLFTPDGRLVVGSGSGVRVWDLDDGNHRILRTVDTQYVQMALSRDGRQLISAGFDLETLEGPELLWQDLESGAERLLPTHGNQIMAVTFDLTGERVISADNLGVVRVGPITGGEPHLLLGHEKNVWRLAVTPDGRRIVSTGADGTVRLWPMPDMNEPPFHTLPYEELLARLRALTNVRAVPDEDSPTGYSLQAKPFPGWAEVPEC